MRRDRLYLDDITEASEAIGRFLAGVSEGAFLIFSQTKKRMVNGNAPKMIADDVFSSRSLAPPELPC